MCIRDRAAIVTAGLSSVNANAATYYAGVVTAGDYAQAFGFGAAEGGPDAGTYGNPETTHYSDTIEFELTAPSYVTVFAKNLSPGFDFEMNAGAVSYTHLDVYKRQTLIHTHIQRRIVSKTKASAGIIYLR